MESSVVGPLELPYLSYIDIVIMSEHSVTIQWGSRTSREEIYEDDNDGHTYNFETQEEKDAFLKGVNEAIGWSERQRVDLD